MVRCCVKGCKSNSGNKIPGLSFHSFPEHDNLRLSWIVATGRTDWTPKPSSKVCCRHFENKMLFKKKKLTLLLPNAVPILGPDAERDQSIPVKREAREDGPRASQIHGLLSTPIQPRGTRLTCAAIKVTSGSSPRFQFKRPPQQSPAFMTAEMKGKAAEAPSGDDTLSCDEEPDQVDDSQPTEDLVPLSVHPVPLSNAPDPLCDVQVKKEEEEGAADERGGDEAWAVREEGRTARVRSELVVNSEPRVVQPALEIMNNQFQIRKQEQKIQNLTRQRDQLRLQVRKLREMIRRRDAKILKLQARLTGLGSGGTREDGAGTCGQADTKQVQSVNPNERKKKANRVLYVVKGADRQKSAQSTSQIRQMSVQDDADILQQSLIGVLDTSAIRQLAVKNTSETPESVIPQNSVNVKQSLDIRRNPSLVIQPITEMPKKPSTGTKRKLIVVKAKSVDPQTNKRKSDIRQNSSIVIHPMLDIPQKVASDIPQKSASLQCPSDIRQNGLVIQIDGMHSTVIQPKLVRLEDNNIDLG